MKRMLALTAVLVGASLAATAAQAASFRVPPPAGVDPKDWGCTYPAPGIVSCRIYQHEGNTWTPISAPYVFTYQQEQTPLQQAEEVNNFNGEHRGDCSEDARRGVDMTVVDGWKQVGGGTVSQVCTAKPSIKDQAAHTAFGLATIGGLAILVNQLDRHRDGYYRGRGY